jgi:hypothetical protein
MINYHEVKGNEDNLKFILRDTFKEVFHEWQINDGYGDVYFNRKQAGEFLGVSLPTFDKLKREGLLVPVVIGSITRYRKSDLLNIGR